MIEEENGDLLVEEDQDGSLEDVIYEESIIEEESLIEEPAGELLEEELVEELPAPETPEVSAVNDLEDLEEITISEDNYEDDGADPARVGDETGENNTISEESEITLNDIYDQNEDIIATLEVISSNVKTTGDNISLIGSIISMVLCMFLGGFIIYCFISRLR